MSLLDDAKAFQSKSRGQGIEITEDVMLLVFAWLRDDVKDIAVRTVLSKHTNSFQQSYPTIARALKKAYKQGRLKIEYGKSAKS
jgi:hypothetical protein